MVMYGAKPNNTSVINKGKLEDRNVRDKADKRGVLLYQVSTIAIKNWLFGRLSVRADRESQDR